MILSVICATTNAKKEITLIKHKNTKHQQKTYSCDKCSMTFHSKEKIELHIMKTHDPEKNDEPDRIKQAVTVTDTEKDNSALKECSLCDDTLLTNEEFKSHVSGHLEEIRDIDIEYLKMDMSCLPALSAILSPIFQMISKTI